MGDAARSAIQAVLDFLGNTASAFWQLLMGWFNAVLGTITSWVSWLESRLVQVGEWLWAQLQAALGGVSGLARGALDAVSAVAGQVTSGAGELLSGWMATISGFFQGGVNYLGGFVERSTQWLGEQVDQVGITIRQEISDPITDFFSNLPERIAAWFSPVIDFFGAFNRVLSQFIFPWEFGEIARAYRTAFNWVLEEGSEAVGAFWDAFIGFISRFAPVTPDSSTAMAGGLLKLAALSAGGLGLMTVGGELLHPLKNMGLGHIAAMIGDIINYRQISGVIMGAILFAGLRTPLTYQFNALLRPQLPDMRTLTSLASEYALVPRDRLEAMLTRPDGLEQINQANQAAFIETGAFHGFTDVRLAQLYQLADTPERYFFLSAIARAGFYDEAYLTRALLNSGYNPATIRAALGMFRSSAELTKLLPSLGPLRTLYRDGFLSREGLRERVQEISGLADPTLAQELAMELAREYQAKSLEQDIILRAYSRGLLSEAEVLQGLRDLGLSGVDAGRQLLREKLGLVRRVTLEVTPVLGTVEEVPAE